MKAKELIQELLEYPPDTTVLCFEKGKHEYTIEDISPAASCISKEHYTIGIMLKEVKDDNKDDFYVGIIKLYFDVPEKSFKTAQRAMEAIDDILYNHSVGDFWTDFGADDSYHAWDIICDFADKKDREKFKKLFMDYGFDIENAKEGFWITGVTE